MKLLRSAGLFSTEKSNTTFHPITVVLIFLNAGTTAGSAGTAAFSITVSLVDGSVVLVCQRESFCVIGKVYVPAFFGATVLIVYLPLPVSFVVRIDPSSKIVSSLNPGVASTVITIGELASTVDAGDIVTP